MLRDAIAAVRTFVFVPLMFVYTMVLALLVLAVAFVNPKSPRFDTFVHHWARVFLKIPPMQVSTEGRDLVDPDTRYVVASNHLSQFDIPLLFTELPVHGRFLAKMELFKLPFIGRAMRAIGIVEINRQKGGSSRDAINEGVRVAAERGYSLLVFPEGTRSRDGALLPFKKGAFRIAIDTGLPLLPVVIEGTDRVSKPGSKIIYPGRARLRILEPIDTTGMTNRDDLKPLLERVEGQITENYREMRNEALDSIGET